MEKGLLIGNVVIAASRDKRIGIIVDQNNSPGMYQVFVVFWEDGKTDEYVRGWQIFPLTENRNR